MRIIASLYYFFLHMMYRAVKYILTKSHRRNKANMISPPIKLTPIDLGGQTHHYRQNHKYSNRTHQ